MTDILNLLAIGVSAFAATNIDDIFLLMMFFSSLSFPVWQVVLGQYIGITLLVAISTLGIFISLVVPAHIIGLLGIVPIAIGIKKIIESRNNDKSTSKHAIKDSKTNLAFMAVAAVTFSNGGDNIGVYTPLFAKYNSATTVIWLVIIFMAMTAIWCSAAYYLVNHPLIASKIRRIGHIVLPFVLIGLGIYILTKSFVFI